MAKDIGMTIRKGIVVSFLPCLVAFWGFHPYTFFHFLNVFLLLLQIAPGDAHSHAQFEVSSMHYSRVTAKNSFFLFTN